MARKFTPIERFVRKIDFITSPYGCWIWQGSFGGHEINPTQAYGRLYLEGKNVMAHRFSYQYFTNTIILKGFQIDHLCHNPRCVNPNHLEMVTSKENSLRSTNPLSSQKNKTHCIRGHILSGKNLYVAKNGSRKCKECIRLRTAQFRSTGKYTLPGSKSTNIWKD